MLQKSCVWHKMTKNIDIFGDCQLKGIFYRIIVVKNNPPLQRLILFFLAITKKHITHFIVEVEVNQMAQKPLFMDLYFI